MKLKIFVVLILIIILFQEVLAQTQINIYLSENGDVKFYGKTIENLSLPEGIYIKQGNIFGITKELTKKDGEIWFFNYSLEGSNLNLILPKYSVIKELNEGEIYMDDGYLSIYNDDGLQVYYILGEDSYINYYISILVLILILVLFIIFYKKIKLLFKKKENIEIIKKTLNEREVLIINKLKEVKEIKQSKLSRLTEIPKASLFRHLINLEKKGIIKRTGEGKNKLISLK